MAGLDSGKKVAPPALKALFASPGRLGVAGGTQGCTGTGTGVSRSSISDTFPPLVTFVEFDTIHRFRRCRVSIAKKHNKQNFGPREIATGTVICIPRADCFRTSRNNFILHVHAVYMYCDKDNGPTFVAFATVHLEDP